MRLQDVISKGFLEFNKVYDKMFGRTGFVTKLIFYPVALDSTSEVIEIANQRDCSEYDVLKHFGGSEYGEDKFGRYLNEAYVPCLIYQKCKNYLSSLQTSASNN